MKTIIRVFIGLMAMTVAGLAQTQTMNVFDDGAIRYDFELIGDDALTEIIPVQIKVLPNWGGQKCNLIDESKLGNMCFDIYDLKSNKLLFKKGFSTLFTEWQSTNEAKSRKRTFYQALYFPKPIADVKLIIYERDKNNQWKSLYVDTVRMTDYFKINETVHSHYLDTIKYSGRVSEKIDLVILAEGYTQAEMGKFRNDAKRLTDSLFAIHPFKNYVERFNVWALPVPSMESGTDVPGNRIYKNTAFNSHFYTFDSPRYLTTTDLRTVYDALDAVPFDHIYVLVNSNRYGGGGFYNLMSVCSSDNDRSPFVFIHEFGHSFAGLGDEYYTSSTSYQEFYNKRSEPWEPNLTTLVDFKSKWKEMIDKNLPVPTPRTDAYQGKVGVFEGGGYEAKGIYSPAMTCWMKEMKAGKFCKVCEQAIIKTILDQTEE